MEGPAHHKLSSLFPEEVSMNQYIGIDISKEALSVFDGEKEHTFRNGRSLAGFKTYLHKRFRFDDIVLIFEATGPYSYYLRDFCAEHAVRVWVVNPKRSAYFAKAAGMRSKTDQIDARTLYTLRKIVEPEDILVPRTDRIKEELSAYLSGYEFAVKMRTAISNRIEALTHNPHTPPVLLTLTKKELARAEKMEELLLSTMESYVEQNDELKRDYHNLLSIKSIGKISAISLLSLFRSYKGTTRSEITALVGLDPTRKESGTSLAGRRKISKSGSSMVRKILYFPTLNAIQHNAKIRAAHQRLVLNHKPKKLAVIAAMRKLLLIAHAIYKNRVVYCDA
jgi:transposase